MWTCSLIEAGNAEIVTRGGARILTFEHRLAKGARVKLSGRLPIHSGETGRVHRIIKSKGGESQHYSNVNAAGKPQEGHNHAPHRRVIVLRAVTHFQNESLILKMGGPFLGHSFSK